MIFVDTSAIYALADSRDLNHERARASMARALESGERLLLHSYVVVESVALLHNRLGAATARSLLDDLFRFDVQWIDAGLHGEAVAEYAQARRGVSFVDCTSFVVMRRRGVTHAIAFDDEFARQGFTLVDSDG